MATADRKALHVYIDPNVHAAWRSYCREVGVTITALVQAIGENLDDLIDPAGGAGAVVIERAREIADDRRHPTG
jgi:hypothetical protein